MSVHFSKVVIIGVGLIGGSLGLIGRKKGIFDEVVGVGRGKENLELAVGRGAVDRYGHDPAEACRDADLVVLAMPVDRILSIGKEIAPHLRTGACVTDVGSVKQELIVGLDEVMPDGVFFVGSHPIAGSEESGAAAAREDLFQGARTIVTPSASTDPLALSTIHSLWEEVGAIVVEMDAAEHDLLLAAVSHLPHMVAYALVNVLAEMQDTHSGVASLAAGGFRDITRIASSHPEMWVEICRMNKNNIVQMIEQYTKSLNWIKTQIQGEHYDELNRVFKRIGLFRKNL